MYIIGKVEYLNKLSLDKIFTSQNTSGLVNFSSVTCTPIDILCEYIFIYLIFH